MKILQVSHGFPPEQAGGTERYTSHLAQALQDRGHEVSVFTRRADWRTPEYAIKEEYENAVRVFRINHTWRECRTFEESYHHQVIADRFGTLLDELQPDLVHIQHLVHLSTHIPDEARRRGIPIVMTFHDFWFMCNQGQLIKRDGSLCSASAAVSCTDCAGLWLGMGTQARLILNILRRFWPEIGYKTSRLRGLAHRYFLWAQKGASQQSALASRMQARRQEMQRAADCMDVGIVLSQVLQEQWARFGLSQDRLIRIPIGIRPPVSTNVKKSISPHLRVAYLGRIIPAKGLRVLLEAARILRPKDIEIHIYGEVPPYGDVNGYAKRMRRLAQEIPAIHWHGRYHHDELGQILANTDVVAVPSIWYENQPLVIMEAFAARTPVVATDLGGMRELVHDGENGVLFGRGDSRALAECLMRLGRDRALLKRLQDGIAPVKDMDTHVEEIEAVYKRLHGYTHAPRTEDLPQLIG